jgi:hypothetical protein
MSFDITGLFFSVNFQIIAKFPPENQKMWYYPRRFSSPRGASRHCLE